jgi:glutaredoxin
MPMTSRKLHHALTCGFALAWACGPALAQYKVVNPDGSVSYTDRPPVTTNARITPVLRAGAQAPAGPQAALPAELRTVVQRHPVTLYTTAECGPCDSGRRQLQQRGVPYAERRIVNEDDAAALQRLVGGRTVPALTIGAQPLRGWSEADWGSYLDAAGYPRESKLPKGWPVAEATPLVERAAPTAVPAAAPAARPPAPAPAPAAEPPAPGTTIRF